MMDSSRWRVYVRPALLLFLFVGAFPDQSILGSMTLDGSWVAEINRLAHRGAFGADWAFTYGPLGWVIHPIDIGWHVEIAGAVRFAATALLVLLAAIWSKGAGTARLVVLCAANVAGGRHRPVLRVPARRDGRASGCRCAPVHIRWATLVLAVLSAVAVFVKLTLGIAATSIAAVVVAIRAVSDARDGRRGEAASHVAVANATYVITLLVMAQSFFGSIRSLPPWLDLSLRSLADSPPR